ncbi:hypothetical protein QL285_070660 [Trifolium repens]|nr:hypothetical protein QL285_070660 [Trifolium repens]
MEDVNRAPKRKPTSAPTPDEVVPDNESSYSNVNDPWDDASDSGTDNDDEPTCVSDTYRPSSLGYSDIGDPLFECEACGALMCDNKSVDPEIVKKLTVMLDEHNVHAKVF